MKTRLKDNWLFILLLALGAVFYFVSNYLFSSPSLWDIELSKKLLDLSFSMGFVGIGKLFYDNYQEDKKKKEREKEEQQEKIEKEKEEERAEKEKVQAFKIDILNRLRKVFDAVDSSRLIIEAHKSAKTYSEKMQQNIIPSIVTLFDIKRSLVDSDDMVEKEKLQHLRIYINYMIAYLQALANEYKNDYLPISNKQSLHEELKKKTVEKFVSDLMKSNPSNYYTNEILLSQTIENPPTWVWEAILKPKQTKLFIKDEYTSPYRKMFVDFYEASKKILKDQPITKQPSWFKAEHLKRMLEIDDFIKESKSMDGISLVNELVDYLIEKSENLN